MSIDAFRVNALPPLSTRRHALMQVGRLVGAATLGPCVGTILEQIRWEEGSITAAARLVRSKASVFEAEAQALELFATLLMVGAAIVTILDYLGIRPSFGRQVDYAPASGASCQYQFQDYHAQWAQNGFQSYAGISRSPREQPMMCLSAADNARLEDSNRAEMVGLYQGYGPLLLKGRELSVIQAAAQKAKDTCSLSDSDRAKVSCITSRSPISSGQRTVWRYCNAQNGYILYCPDSETDGVMAVHVAGRTDPTKPLQYTLRS